MSDLPPPSPVELPPLRRRLVGGTAWAAFGRFTVVLTALGTNALAARILAPSAAGTFFLATSAVTFGVVFAQTGLQRVAVRFVAGSLAEGDPGRARAAIRTVLRQGWILSLSLAALFALPPVRALVDRVFAGTRLGEVLWIVALALVVRALTVLRAETFRGFQDMPRATIFGGVDAGVITVLLLGAVWLYTPSLHTLGIVLGIVVIAWLPSLVASSVTLRRRVAGLPEGGGVSVAEVYTVAWPVFVGNFGTFLMAQADLWVVGARLAGPDVAVYGASLRLMNLVTIPLQVVNLVLPPIIAELYSRGETARLQRVLRTMATVSAVPSVVVLLAFVAFGGPILGLVYGPFYTRGGTVLAVLSIGAIISALTGSCGYTLTMTRHERTSMVTSLVGGLVLVVASLVLVGRFGLVAVAAASSFVLGGSNIAQWIAARKLVGVYTHAGIGPAVAIIRSVLRGPRGLRGLLGER